MCRSFARRCVQCPNREIENLDDIDGKDTVWDETECSEQQPDDMAILVDWFSCYNETKKLARYAAVSRRVVMCDVMLCGVWLVASG